MQIKAQILIDQELKIEGMIGSHLVISSYWNDRLSSMCMTNGQNISINTRIAA